MNLEENIQEFNNKSLLTKKTTHISTYALYPIRDGDALRY